MDNDKVQYDEFAKNEFLDYRLYKSMAKSEQNPHNKEMLEKLAEQEHTHYLFWKKFSADTKGDPYVSPWFFFRFNLMKKVLGLTFTIKFLERHEGDVIKDYEKVSEKLSENDKAGLKKIIGDEKEHEKFFITQLKETVIKYIGFIALGLADAIVEISGTHTGFLGVTNSTLFAGVSGLIVGFAAAISMASASYIQAKQDLERSAVISAAATGISYIIAVIILAVPYFLSSNMCIAFIISIINGIILITFLTFYTTIVFDRRFWKDFIETTSLMLITAAATFLLGSILGKAFHLQQ